ncbi:MAG TPA: hypothetical protein VFP73_15225 [Terrabacter sp.]|nr:hypothetical protein [Terrabacter sp.]
MLLLVHAPRPRAVAILRDAAIPGRVGPSSATGWTAAWLDESADALPVRPAESHVVLSEGGDGLTIGIHPADGEPTLVARRWSEPLARSDEAAAALTFLFGLRGDARPEDVAETLAGDLDLEALLWDLERLLELPPLEPPPPDRSVVVTRCDPSLVRLLARTQGPLRLVRRDDWILVAPTDEVADLTDTGWALADAGGSRDVTILLWRRGLHQGFRIARGRRAASWDWNDPWQGVGLPHEDPTAAAEAVQALSPHPLSPDDASRLRALLHRPGPEPLAELTRLLGLPPVASQVLSQESDVPLDGEERLEPAPLPRGLLEAMVEAYRHPRPVRRSLRFAYGLFAMGTVAATVVVALLAMLSIVVLATDGSVVDQAGTGFGDWAFAGLAVVGTGVLAPTSVYRIRRLRGRSSR